MLHTAVCTCMHIIFTSRARARKHITDACNPITEEINEEKELHKIKFPGGEVRGFRSTEGTGYAEYSVQKTDILRTL